MRVHQPHSACTYTMILVLHLLKTSNAACPEKCSCKEHFIDCTNAGLTTVPWNLPDPVGLQTLLLKGNDIRELVAEIVSYSNLQVLDLSNNKMRSVEDSVFQSLVNLKTLSLSNNQLDALTANTFKGLSSLEVLDVSSNNIRDIKDSPFTDLGKLQELDLSGNSIRTISPIGFLGMVALRSLSLNQNDLKDVPVESFVHISKLHHLSLSDNDFSNVHSGSFTDLKALQTLDLDGNGIHTISQTAFGDKFGHEVKVLSLRNNDLSVVPSAALSSLTSVQTIDLSENPISVVDPDAFKSLEQLQQISLESMPKLQVIRSYSFSELEKLISLSIHSNPKLRTIEKDAFLASGKVKRVDLHSNALVTFDSQLLDWSQLELLDLRFNNWNCDCHLDFLPPILQSFTNKTLASHVLCATPSHLASEAVVHLSSDQFECDVQVKKLEKKHFEDRIMIGIIAGTSCFLLLAMSLLMWRSRHTMFGSGPIPVTYRVSRSGMGNSSRNHREEEDNNSDDRLAIAENEEEQPDQALERSSV